MDHTSGAIHYFNKN